MGQELGGRWMGSTMLHAEWAKLGGTHARMWHAHLDRGLGDDDGVRGLEHRLRGGGHGSKPGNGHRR